VSASVHHCNSPGDLDGMKRSFLGSSSPRILRRHGLQGSSFWRFCLEKAPIQGARRLEKME
jgi:hypothetical protein